jgi:hypothetical protein
MPTYAYCHSCLANQGATLWPGQQQVAYGWYKLRRVCLSAKNKSGRQSKRWLAIQNQKWSIAVEWATAFWKRTPEGA